MPRVRLCGIVHKIVEVPCTEPFGHEDGHQYSNGSGFQVAWPCEPPEPNPRDEFEALRAQATRLLNRLASDGQTPCDDTDCGDLLCIEQRALRAMVEP